MLVSSHGSHYAGKATILILLKVLAGILMLVHCTLEQVGNNKSKDSGSLLMPWQAWNKVKSESVATVISLSFNEVSEQGTYQNDS